MKTKGISKSFFALALAAGLVAQGINPVFADGGNDSKSVDSGSVEQQDGPIFPRVFGTWDGKPRYASTIPGGTAPLTYHGGVAGTGDLTSKVGVTTGKPLVYLIIWGSQWGTKGVSAVDNSGVSRDSFSGDTKGMIPYLESFIAGLGTNNETWSGVLSEFCDGVAVGATSCPASATATRVGYPGGAAMGGALAGVFYDTATAAPANATQAQLGAEAVKAASFFGRLTQSSNRSVQYVVVSPTGTHPDGFNTATGNFCAYHTYQPSAYGNLAFTNLPYIPDLGASCGMNSVNPTSGTLDGVSIVEGHEYAETVTDQWPSGGWYDGTSGAENGDKCSWQGATGGNGGNLVLATGTFAMQGTWSNLTAACSMGTPLSVKNSTFGVLTNSVTSQKVITGGNLPYTLTVNSGALPAGLTLNADGTLTGTATTPVSSSLVNITAVDASGSSVSTDLSISVQSAVVTTTSLVTSATAATSTTPISLTATVLPATAGQSVTFKDGTTVLGSGLTDANGVVTLAARTFAAGNHSITSAFAGSGIYLASTSPAVVVSVAAAISSLVLTTNVTTGITPSTSVTMTATISPIISSATITFYDGGTSLGTARTSATGVATLAKTFAGTVAGTSHSLTAKFAGSTAATASTSNAVTITSTIVAPGAPTAPKLNASTTTSGNATATWTAPTSTGGSTITAYTVYVYQGSVLLKTVAGPTSRTVTITGLTSASVLNIKVSATNVAGEGPQSVASATATIK